MKIDDTIFWINHAGFYIKAKGKTIFIDPFMVSDKVKEKADLILISHSHPDHLNIDDIKKVAKADTKFILANKCEVPGIKSSDIIGKATPGSKHNFNGISIEAVHAYNNHPDRLKFHPKEEDWVGYIIDIDGFRIYHAGDTDHIPEMKMLKNLDVAMLPMGGFYTMNPEDGMNAAETIKPKIVVPMHYKRMLGKEKSLEFEKEIKAKLGNALVMKEIQEPIYS